VEDNRISVFVDFGTLKQNISEWGSTKFSLEFISKY